MKTNYIEITKDNKDVRLDKYLLSKFKNLNFTSVQKLIRLGYFKVNKKKKNLITSYNYLIKSLFLYLSCRMNMKKKMQKNYIVKI